MSASSRPFVRRAPAGPRRAALGAASLAVLAAAGLGVAGAPAVAQGPGVYSPDTIPDLVERVSPAVVSVLVEREVDRPRMPPAFEEFFRFRFGEPFGDPFQQPEGEDDGFGGGGTQRMQAQGSGFFIDAKGHIVTNNHVIEEADEVRVRLADGEELEATVVGADPLTDLAVLRVEAPRGQRFVAFDADADLRVGETVVAVGNPFGLGGTVTSGIVSALGGDSRQGQFLDYMQIDAPINRGNSGGPTFDLDGNVVGVNVAIYSPNGGSVGIGFAIPAAVAAPTVAQIVEKGGVTRGWLGVSLRDVDPTLAAALGRKTEGGAFVNDVVPDTPAEKGGLRAGDLVIAVNRKSVADTSDLSRTIAAYPPGETVTLRYVRDGKEGTTKVTLGERTADAGAPESAERPGDGASVSDAAGLRVSPLTDAARLQYSIPDGIDGAVVTGVRRGGPAAEAGLRPGMVILEADGKPVTGPGALKETLDGAVKAGKEALLLRVQAGETRQFAALALDAETAGD